MGAFENQCSEMSKEALIDMLGKALDVNRELERVRAHLDSLGFSSLPLAAAAFGAAMRVRAAECNLNDAVSLAETSQTVVKQLSKTLVVRQERIRTLEAELARKALPFWKRWFR